MSIVRWLHISDLHYNYDSYATTEMRTKMLESLPNVMKGKGMPEYLFVTGDLRYGKNSSNEFPDSVTTDIKRLMDALRIIPQNVHIAMGNHDVTQEFKRNERAAKIHNHYRLNNTIDKETLRELALSQEKFYKVYESICNRTPHPHHSVVETADFNIICLNTAFASWNSSDNKEQIVGMDLIQSALANINYSKPGIAIAHHPLSSLYFKDRDALEIKLKESGVLLYLCGHEHLADCRIIDTRRETPKLFEYVCGTEMDKHPNNQYAEMVVFQGELDTESKTGSVQGWEWVPRSSAWMPYRELSYKQTKRFNGIHYFPENAKVGNQLFDSQIALPYTRSARYDKNITELSIMFKNGVVQKLDKEIRKSERIITPKPQAELGEHWHLLSKTVRQFGNSIAHYLSELHKDPIPTCIRMIKSGKHTPIALADLVAQTISRSDNTQQERKDASQEELKIIENVDYYKFCTGEWNHYGTSDLHKIKRDKSHSYTSIYSTEKYYKSTLNVPIKYIYSTKDHGEILHVLGFISVDSVKHILEWDMPRSADLNFLKLCAECLYAYLNCFVNVFNMHTYATKID